jgi:hypothetical protein
VATLKLIKNHQLDLRFALESNRLVSVEKGVWVQAQQLTIPEEGLAVWLKQTNCALMLSTCLTMIFSALSVWTHRLLQAA